ncbi:MAG: pitrilysin family protein [Elusimicrobiota bacterium]
MKQLLLLALTAATASPAAAIAYRRHQLANGLVVLLHKNDSAPTVAINIWYKVGSKHESPGRTGFAHLFEHYMFECSKHVPPGGYDAVISKRLGGMNNAFTAHDKTNYFAVVTKNGLDAVLQLESDRMGFLQDCLNQKSLDQQRGVVQNEKRQREGEPYSGAEQIVTETFQAPHPYSWNPIGLMKDLEAATLEDVSQFHKTFYLPNNAVLAIAGDIDEDQTLERARFWFEGLPGGAAPPQPRFEPLTRLDGRREKTITDERVRKPMLVMGFPVPGRGQPGSDEAAALASILAEGRASRLVKALRDGSKPIALDVSAGMVGLNATDLFIIQAIPTEGTSLADLEIAIHAEIGKLAKHGPLAGEINRVKAKMETAFTEGLGKINVVAQNLAEGEAVVHDPNAFLDGEAGRIGALNQALLKKAAKRMTPGNVSVIKIIPAPEKKP